MRQSTGVMLTKQAAATCALGTHRQELSLYQTDTIGSGMHRENLNVLRRTNRSIDTGTHSSV
ncbi:hypothetical protein [Alicyclobacillus fodiniaquatilis]|uniref:Uncharacterized protein n=1 Tax=Alicyclobacillus fodiniaquatilis TaxID=1661150 RepID=A0ABW4JQH6_9BACL